MERTGGRAVRIAALMVMAIVAGLVVAGLWLGRDQAGRDGMVKVNGWYCFGDFPPWPEAPEGYRLAEYWIKIRNSSDENLPPARNIRVILPTPVLGGKRMEVVRMDNFLSTGNDFAARAGAIKFSCTPVSYPYEGLEFTFDELRSWEAADFRLYYFVRKEQENFIGVPRTKTGDIVVYLEWEGLIADIRQTLDIHFDLTLYRLEEGIFGPDLAPYPLILLGDYFPNYGPGWYLVNNNLEWDWSEYLGPTFPENLFA